MLAAMFAGIAYQLWIRSIEYRQRIFELTGGQECSNLVKVVPSTPPPPAPPKETTVTALMEMDCKRMDEWREELLNHYRTDLKGVSTEWNVCKLDKDYRAISPISIPADIAVIFFARMSKHLYRRLNNHKENMKKCADIE